MNTESATFTGAAGTRLAGVLHTFVAPTLAAVIVAHGFCSNKNRERYIRLAEALAAGGIAALRFDFGGSGESEEREITMAAQAEDLHSAMAYLKGRGYERIGVMGESLGGIVALTAYDSDISALVLWAPVTKARWTAKVSEEQKKTLEEQKYYIKHYDGRDFKIPQTYVKERLSIDREKVLSSVKVPVLIIHGTDDATVPISDSKEAISLLPMDSRLEEIKGADHHMSASEINIVVPKTVDWFVAHLLGENKSS